jgi:hypothetical protein
MKISRIFVPPISVDLAEQQWQVPCYSLSQYTSLGAYIDSKMLDEATKGMTEQQRFQHLAFYGVMPMSLPAIRRFSLTPDGLSRVLHDALKAARIVGVRDSEDKPFRKLDTPRKIEDEVIEGFIEFGEDEEKEALVRLIMRIPVEQPAAIVAAAKASGQSSEQEGGDGNSPDPTKPGSDRQKNVGLATGMSNSASSERRTPAPTR